ncbi:MAG: hypothetical protein ACLFVP_02715 [Candidatus Bathyarchaeia archaeon]
MGETLATMSKNLTAPWLLRITWEELLTLILCLTLDIFDYFLPILLSPVYGDIWDFVGFVFCVIYFGIIGAISLLELFPGFDVVPIFTITWLIWFFYKRHKMKREINSELDEWR